MLRRRAAAACWRSAWSAQAPKTHATNSLLHISLTSFCHEGRYFSPLHEGHALCLQDMSRRTARCCLSFIDSLAIPLWAGASAFGLLEVRVVYTIFARHKPKFCAFSCGFSICNILLSVFFFRFLVPWSSHAVRFCSLSGVGSVSSRQPCSTFGSSISTVEVCSFIRGIRC